MSYLRISNKIIEWGVIFLIAFTPVAFGAVHRWAYTLMELTICFLVIIWIVRLAMINLKQTIAARFQSNRNSKSRIPNPESRISILQSINSSINPSTTQSSLVNRFGFIKTPLNIPIFLFVALILFQLTPLPPGVIKIISSKTYELYQTTIPGWPADEVLNPKSLINESTNIESSLITNQSPIPNPQSQILSWRPLTIYKYATQIELYKMLAYIGMFFLIVNYNPSTRSTQPVNSKHRLRIRSFIIRLVIAMVVVGSLESVYGMLETLSGHQHIFLSDNSSAGGFVTGTYINRNNFAGYMAIVICMSIGYLTYILYGISKSKSYGWREKLGKIINIIGAKTGLFIFMILIMSSALVLSGSRMGIASFITAIILMSIMIPKQVSRKKICFILLPIFLMTLWIGLDPVTKRFSVIGSHLESEAGRIQVWKDTGPLIKDFPSLGTGLGTYDYAFPKYKTFKKQTFFEHAHNDYLELISNTGFVGFIIIIAGGAYYLFMVTRLLLRRRDPFVRCMSIGCLGGISYIILHSLTDFNLQIPANALHLSIITGIMHKTVTQV